jgi:peptide/nickel transport system permease protein
MIHLDRADRRLRLGGMSLVTISILLGAAALLQGIDLGLDMRQRLQAPSAMHILGTDALGRDVLSCLAFGTLISLAVALAVVASAAALGAILGFLAGWHGGPLGACIMRISDFVLAFPGILLALLLAAFWGQGIWTQVLALSLTGWVSHARLVRGEVLKIKRQDYILAARGFNAHSRHIAVYHILPQVFPVLLTQAVSGIAAVILAEASLNFLGLGLDPRWPTLGGMIDAGRGHLFDRPDLVLVPGALLGMLVAAFQLLAEGIRLRPGTIAFEKKNGCGYNGASPPFPWTEGGGRMKMEKRREMRIKKRMLSNLEGKPAIIVDISQSGIKISMSRPPKSQEVEIKLQIGDKVISVRGDVRWITRMVSTRVTNDIGIAIREAPDEYYELVSSSG